MTKTELNPTQDLELTVDLNGQPFVITGDSQLLQDMYEQEESKYKEVSKAERHKKIGIAVVEAVESPLYAALGSFASQLRMDVSAALYDRRNGTNFLGALREKRQLEKDLRMAGKLGLLQEEVCAKHRKALEDVKKVR